MSLKATYDLQIDTQTDESALQIAALVAHTYGAENIKVHGDGTTITLSVADVSLADCVTITRQVGDILADNEPNQ
jgi:hypothetical protein